MSSISSRKIPGCLVRTLPNFSSLTPARDRKTMYGYLYLCAYILEVTTKGHDVDQRLTTKGCDVESRSKPKAMIMLTSYCNKYIKLLHVLSLHISRTIPPPPWGWSITLPISVIILYTHSIQFACHMNSLIISS